jgi:eukaryotic-like serine/threonine-protein kinase
VNETPPPPGTDGEGAPSPFDLTGTVLAGRYRIVQRLGVGAMGEVYLGEHLRMGRRDAIKVLRAGMARDPEAIARFTRGARNVARIRHPNVCQVYDFGEAEDGVLFLAMEYVDGGSLGELLNAQGPLEPERAAHFLHQAAEALHAAHELGIVHRDLKPDNLMVTQAAKGRAQIKVVDFDIARGPADEEGAGVTRHGFVVGTPEYMSPEQLTGDPLDRRSDVYSLTLVLVRMLTGNLPFSGKTAQEVMLQRLTGEPASLGALAPPGVTFPQALEVAVRNGLARLPDQRTPSSRDLAREVHAALGTGTGTAAGRGPQPSSDAGSIPPATPTAVADTGAGASQLPGTEVAPASKEAVGQEEKRRWVATTGVGVGILALGAVVWVLVGGGERGSDGSLAPLPSEATPMAQEIVQEPSPGGADADGPSSPGVEAMVGETAASTASPTPAASTPDPTPAGSSATAAPGITLPVGPGEARPVLMRQFTLLDDTGGAPSTAVRRAARDTTQAVWAMPGLSSADSAFAAHVLGLSLISLGDSIRGVDWLDTAVRLDPLEIYVRVRDVHRRPPR